MKRPNFTLYHANRKGTGSAASFELVPAHDDYEGFIQLSIAPQLLHIDIKAEDYAARHFDWSNRLSYCLGFNELAKMLQVFRGETESINDGKGVIHFGDKTNSCFRLSHRLEPATGYSIELNEWSRNGKNDVDERRWFFLQPSEALGLCAAIENLISVISFGIPAMPPNSNNEGE